MNFEMTSPTLLEGIRQGDDHAWQRFYDTYKVLVYMRAKAWHFSAADTDDLLMKVMEGFFDKQHKFTYDRSKGRFRDYFSRIIRNAAADMCRANKRRAAESLDAGESTIDVPVPDISPEEEKEQWESLVFGKALEAVRSEAPPLSMQCWLSCRLNNVNAKKVAAFNRISLASVYNYCKDIDNRIKIKARQLFENE